MLADLAALLDMPMALLIVLAIGGVIGIVLENTLNALDREKRRAYWRGRNWRGKNGRRADGGARPVPAARAETGSAPGGSAYAADQLRLVMQADFAPRPLLNAKERRLLACLDKVLAAEAPAWRAMGQVSLGEVVASGNEAAFFAVNSKRVDLLIIDGECRPLFAIEYQGTGHHLGKTAIARDAVKMEALRKAGIGYETVRSGDTPADLRALVRKAAGRLAA